MRGILTDTLSLCSLAVFLAYIPTPDVGALSVAIKAPMSRLYTDSSGIAKQLSQVLNPTLPLTAYSAQGVSNAADSAAKNGSDFDSSAAQDDSVDEKRRTIIIAVTVSCGGIILVVLAYLAFGKARKNSKNSGRRGQDNMRQLRLNRDPSTSMYAPGHSPAYAFPGGRANPRNDYPRPTSEASFSGTDDSHSSSGSNGWGQTRASGRSSSIDFATVHSEDVRNSWWRFSDGGRSGDGHAGSSPNYGTAMTSPVTSTASPRTATRQNSNRRITFQRGVRGQVSGISRPQMQENSLLL